MGLSTGSAAQITAERERDREKHVGLFGELMFLGKWNPKMAGKEL